jgi:acetoin:2,6-dichlorophenolindophenol oxidoreductase subunit alpha
MAQSLNPDVATQREMYRRMTLAKQNDDRTRKVIKTGKLVMPYYSSRGQECIPAAVSVNLSDDDYICTTYRGIHDTLAKGVPLRDVWAELAGKATGTCKGKGGPMHITHPKSGVMITTGIVGSTMPIANGLAWGSQLRGDGRVTIAYFGDGASNIGAFHEALNLASLWKLPVVFVCQNNRYAEHTKYAKGTSVDRISMRSASYSMPGVTVDGNDPCSTYIVAREAIARARSGLGPTLIEALTFRFFGHNYGDADGYMDKGEKAAAMAADPVPRFRAHLIDDGIATKSELDDIEAGIERDLDAAVEFALRSPFPEIEELRHDVYAHEVLE